MDRGTNPEPSAQQAGELTTELLQPTVTVIFVRCQDVFLDEVELSPDFARNRHVACVRCQDVFLDEVELGPNIAPNLCQVSGCVPG